jgi:glycosyltransferase involved in cell wall biosynthesis
MAYTLHICNNYLFSNLYHNLFTALEAIDEKNIIYVPGNSQQRVVSYKLDFLNKTFNYFSRSLFFPKQKAIFNDISNKEYLSDIKIIHAHTLFSAGYCAYKIYKEFKINYIVTVRNTDVNAFFRYMVHLRTIGIQILCSAKKIIFLSAAYKKNVLMKYIPNELREKVREMSVVIPNGIDDFFLANKYYKIREITNNIKLLFIGEINGNKNIITTIKACILLQNMGYNISYTIVGRIKNSYYENLIKKYSFIKYYSHCNKEQIVKYMRDADIFVMPSITETFGLVYPEAMSQGLPVIYSKGQGFDGYFLDGEVGYAVNCFDYKNIAQKILEIYSNYNSISLKCTNYSDKFSWKDISLEYKKIYNANY